MRTFNVAPVADIPELSVTDAVGDEDTPIPLIISAGRHRS